ncbi:hypothetical protein J6590_038514 [Homalodisca vitripennis]|nr:hypothetical protein J6590_038514 [Homalodisca vitripennis]
MAQAQGGHTHTRPVALCAIVSALLSAVTPNHSTDNIGRPEGTRQWRAVISKALSRLAGSAGREHPQPECPQTSAARGLSAPYISS